MERRDLTRLGLAAFVVVAAWTIALGWRGRTVLTGHDALSQTLPAVQDFLTHGSDWRRVAVRPQLLGGVPVAGTGHLFPLFTVAGWLGLGAPWALNLAVLFVQTALAFLTMRLTSDLANLWRGGPRKTDWLFEGAVAALAAFYPAFGWRIEHGHLNLILGSGVVLVLWQWACAWALGNLTAVSLAVGGAWLANAAVSSGQQTAVYGIFFGLPASAALAWLLFRAYRERSPKPALGGTLALLTFGLGIGLWGLSRWWALWQFATSSDSARSFGASVLYSFTVHGWKDWAASLPWSLEAARSLTGEASLHETNVPFGPLLVFFPLLFRLPRAKALGVALVTSGLVAMAFSMKVYPVSDLLPAIFPPLKAFRVPGRAMLPLLALLVPCLASAVAAAFGAERPAKEPKWALGAVVAAVLVFPLAGECLVWAAALFLVAKIRRGRGASSLVPASWILAVLCASALVSFRDRQSPKPEAESLVPPAVRERLAQAEPSLRSPLTRVVPELRAPAFDANQAYWLGLSSLDGYWYPTRRFQSLVAALDGTPQEATAMGYRFTARDPTLSVLRHLYNVRFRLRFDRGRWEMHPFAKTAGEVWFSREVIAVGSMGELSRRLRELGESLADAARGATWIVAGDPKASPAPVEGDCASATARVEHAGDGGQSLTVLTRTSGTCPMTAALSYLEGTAAWGLSPEGRRERLSTFPSYGAMLGVVVPSWVTRVELDGRVAVPPPLETLSALGLALQAAALGGLLLLSSKRRRVGALGSAVVRA
jgi:hypothetical protein